MKKPLNIISFLIKVLVIAWAAGHIARGTASIHHTFAVILVFGDWFFKLIDIALRNSIQDAEPNSLLLLIPGRIRSYKIYKKCIANRILGVSVRKLFWQGFRSGTWVPQESAVLLTLRTCRRNWDPKIETARKFSIKNARDTIFVRVPLDLQSDVFRVLNEVCPMFTISE